MDMNKDVCSKRCDVRQCGNERRCPEYIMFEHYQHRPRQYETCIFLSIVFILYIIWCYKANYKRYFFVIYLWEVISEGSICVVSTACLVLMWQWYFIRSFTLSYIMHLGRRSPELFQLQVKNYIPSV